MTKMIGAALIVLSLAGCAGENLIGESAWSKNYWKIEDKNPKNG